MDQGHLVPDELTCDLVVDRIKQADCKNGYVLDGFPRTIPQAEALKAALEKMGETIDYAINVEVPDENIVNRMGGRRACPGCGCTYHIKHNPPKVEDICDVTKRLSVYHEQTKPLIDFYKKEGVLREVDGTQDLNDVFQAITEILGA